jgi:glutathione S-transferase
LGGALVSHFERGGRGCGGSGNERCLASTPYLAGPAFTVADAYLFVMIGWPPYFKVDLRPFPNLTRYHARIAERPSFLRMKEVIGPVLGRLKLPTFPVFPSAEER